MQSRSSLWPWIIVVLLVIGAGWWLLRQYLPDAAERPAATQARQQAPSPPAPAPAEQAPPAIQHPIDTSASADAAAPALPTLADSDGPAWEALAQVVGDDNALSLLLREHLI